MDDSNESSADTPCRRLPYVIADKDIQRREVLELVDSSDVETDRF